MNKIIIVTGSNGQLGKSLTKKLLNDGFEVYGLDIDHDDHDFKNYSKFKLDISNVSEIENFFDEIKNENVVGLVNNAGIAVFTPFEDRTYEDVQKVIDVNIHGTIFMTKSFMKVFGDKTYNKKVVNLGSIYGDVAPDLSIYDDTPRMSSEIYGMTKAAIINFTKYMTSYYRGFNTNFNSVSPGGIEFQQGEIFKKKYSDRVPMNRMAQSDEVADAIIFLLSEKSNYINGENIFVDGGLTKW